MEFLVFSLFHNVLSKKNTFFLLFLTSVFYRNCIFFNFFDMTNIFLMKNLHMFDILLKTSIATLFDVKEKI